MDPERMMAQMMQNMGMNFGGFGMPFGGMLDPFNQNRSSFPSNPTQMMNPGFMSPMMNPVGFMPMMNASMMNPGMMMQSMTGGMPNGSMSYCSSSVTSYTTDQNGRPQVYQQSQEVKQGPNGIKETKSAIRDSRTGQQELSIGHHINDKAHIKKKAKNVYSGEEEQVEDFVNLGEDEVDTFEQTWTQQARSISQRPQDCIRSSQSSQPHRLAITNATYPSSVQQPNQRTRNPSKVKKEKKRKDKESSSSHKV